MGKKKNAKKLAAQQQNALSSQPNPMTTTTPKNEAAQPAAQGLTKGQKKKARKQRKAMAASAQHGTAQQDATACFSSGPGHGGEDHLSQNDFVGQGLLDALDTIQGEAQPGAGPKGRKTSLASRPAPTGPKSQVKQRRPQPGPPPAAPFQPGAWTSAAAAPPPMPTSSAQAAPFTPQQDNPYGYNLLNATWDWNSLGSADAASGNGAALSSTQQPSSTSAAYWPNSYTTMGSFAQQAYNAQPHHHGMAPDGGVWLPQAFPAHQPAYHAGYPSMHTTFPPHHHYFKTPTWHLTQPTAPFTTKSRSGPRSPSPPTGPRRSRRLASPSSRSGPPQPVPTPTYLAQSALPPTRLPSPQPLLIIIDLNGTLVHRPSSRHSSRIRLRPNVPAFLAYLLANHTVMIWSSARPENVSKMCAQLFAPPLERGRLVAEWGRDTLGLTQAQYGDKVQVYKELRKVWRCADEKGWFPKGAEAQPGVEGRNFFGQHNTLLIDDSMLKASAEPWNLIQVDEFVARDDQMRTDVLREVVGYLEEARWVADVSAWVRSGEGRFEVGGRWREARWPGGLGAVGVEGEGEA